MNEYPVLAKSLLDSGDSAKTVAEFLHFDYGLDREQAKAAIILARGLRDESDGEGPAAAPSNLKAR